MTKYDKLHAMTVDELAVVFAYASKSCPPNRKFRCGECGAFQTCSDCWKDFLETEADESRNDLS